MLLLLLLLLLGGKLVVERIFVGEVESFLVDICIPVIIQNDIASRCMTHQAYCTYTAIPLLVSARWRPSLRSIIGIRKRLSRCGSSDGMQVTYVCRSRICPGSHCQRSAEKVMGCLNQDELFFFLINNLKIEYHNTVSSK